MHLVSGNEREERAFLHARTAIGQYGAMRKFFTARFALEGFINAAAPVAHGRRLGHVRVESVA